MTAEDQPRNGGRFAPKPQPERERTATEILDAAACRQGFLIPPPDDFDEFTQIINFHGKQGDENEAQWLPNTRRLNSLKAWIIAVLAHPEGLSSDLWRCWLAWVPVLEGVKQSNRGWFDAHDQAARMKAVRLRERAAAERAALYASQWRDLHREKYLEAIAEAEKVLAQKRADLEAFETDNPPRSEAAA